MWRQTDRAAEGTVTDIAEARASLLKTAKLAPARSAVPIRSRGFPTALATAIVGDDPGDNEVKLSPRETECLEWTAQGKTTWEIAQILQLSDSTVNYYIRNAMKKLAVHTKAHAVSKAAVLGMFG